MLEKRDEVTRATYVEHWCSRCLHGPDCPLEVLPALAYDDDELRDEEIVRRFFVVDSYGLRGRCRMFTLNPAKAE